MSRQVAQTDRTVSWDTQQTDKKPHELPREPLVHVTRPRYGYVDLTYDHIWEYLTSCVTLRQEIRSEPLRGGSVNVADSLSMVSHHFVISRSLYLLWKWVWLNRDVPWAPRVIFNWMVFSNIRTWGQFLFFFNRMDYCVWFGEEHMKTTPPKDW